MFRNTTSSWICTEIEVDGEIETIKSTAEHPYFILNAKADRQIINFEGRDESQYDGQWVAAKDLQVGDNVLLSNGKTAIITKNIVEQLDKPKTTYNFEVADFHTYYVGEQGILVHNACRAEAMRQAKAELGIADDAIPDGSSTVRMTEGVNGKPYNAKVYRYGDKWIRDDMGGHRFWNKLTRGYDKLPSHLNIGQTVNGVDIQFKGIHFFYT